MAFQHQQYDVAIVGGGITGTALAHVLSRYTDIKRIVLLEKYQSLAMVNSHHTKNSQTLHFGDIENNYPLEKARLVNEAAELVKAYVENHGWLKSTHNKTKKLLLAVGEHEVKTLNERYDEVKELYPHIQLIDEAQIGRLESLITEGRGPSIPLRAIVSEDGYAIDFKSLSEHFVANSNVETQIGTKVSSITKKDDYEISTSKGTIRASAVVVSAGAHSLHFAKKLGHGLEYAILPVAGSFYIAKKKLSNKVYTMQMEKLPFAAIHGDPEAHDPTLTRFGPTAKVVPVLERGNYRTFIDFVRVNGFDIGAMSAIARLLADPTFFAFAAKNFAYDLPVIGKRLYLRQIRKIIPTMTARDLTYAKGYGGLRPQIIHKPTAELKMGDVKIEGDNIIFNMTPSPGASVCLKAAEQDAKTITTFLGKNFNEDKFNAELRP